MNNRVDVAGSTGLASRARPIRLDRVGGRVRRSHLRPNVVLQRDGIVVLLVMGAVDERHRSAPGGGDKITRHASGRDSSSRKYRVRNRDHFSGS